MSKLVGLLRHADDTVLAEKQREHPHLAHKFTLSYKVRDEDPYCAAKALMRVC
jgi:hypothetical protein